MGIRHEHGRVVSLLGTEAAETAFNIYRVSRDNSQADIAGEPLLRAYRLDGTMQWQINLGRNIREGVHCMQCMVYDLDGGGRAEVACRTADGTITDSEASSNNGTKATPVPSADILGGWREEVIWRSADNQSLRFYATVIPASPRLYTLMEEPQCRVSVAWQNGAYNQPPHTRFYGGNDMRPAPRRQIVPVARPARGRSTAFRSRAGEALWRQRVSRRSDVPL